jgi:hypothetical protein
MNIVALNTGFLQSVPKIKKKWKFSRKRVLRFWLNFGTLWRLSLWIETSSGKWRLGHIRGSAYSPSLCSNRVEQWSGRFASEGTVQCLSTELQPQFPRIVIGLSWTHVTEWCSAYWGNGNAVSSICAALFSKCVQLRPITILGICGCVSVASFLGVPSPSELR